MTSDFQLVRSTHAFEHLRGEWTALLDGSGICSPFLTWEWMFTWWQHYGLGRGDRELAIVVVRRNGTLEAVLPGYVRRNALAMRTFAFLGTEYESSDYLQAIGPQGGAPGLAATLTWLLEEDRRIDVLELSNILFAHPTLEALESFARASGSSYEVVPHRVCPYIHLPGGWDAYLATVSGNMRWKVRRCTRRLTEMGAEFTWVCERPEVRAAVAELFELHARRFESKAAASMFRADVRQPFHAEVAERFFDRDILRLFRLRVGGRTVASLYCFEYGGGLYYFQAGIDPAWESHSVGVVVMGHAIRYACEKGLRLFDFMRGGEAYKFRWTSTTRQIVATRIGVSASGRAALAMRRHGATAKRFVKRLVQARWHPAAPTQVTS